MTDEEKQDRALETLFESARRDAPELSNDFLARLEADAALVIASQQTMAQPTSAQVSFWSRVSSLFFPVSGLATATLAGIWIGFQMPESDFASNFTFLDSTDFDVSAFLPAAGLSGFADVGVDG